MKILYVTTVIGTVNAFLIPHIEMLLELGYEVEVAANVNSEVAEELKKLDIKIHNISFNRNPMTRDNLNAYKKIKNLILLNQYYLVHTHTPVASAIVRLACKNMDVNIFYTAHGFHFYKGAPLTNWLVYYPVERWLSSYTDTLITINQEDYNRAKKFKKTNTVYVPGVGIDLEEIRNVKIDRDKKREELGISKESFLITSVGELNQNKNHRIIIEALAQLNNENIHYAICGTGNLKNKLIELSQRLGIVEQVHLLGFRTDVHEINKASDLFVFPSYREGLPVSVMEAMAAGLPVVASDIRGNEDLIDEKGGYLQSPNDVKGFARGIERLFNEKDMRYKMGEYNQRYVEKYALNNVLDSIKSVYLEDKYFL